ncbi:ABC transporter substrate-binding protein [Yinghuangia sp. KLBMP8922]|uniref:ABC transporter substrate-binding protein n=2 Tax=Yinghuangia soli TaxID=2908204 RepID=A0AA41PZH6_9ACTN|nr:ABC transporter substrate-binding protein [Yinghuangia soli]
MSALYDPLVTYDPKSATVKPHLAKSLTTRDGTVWLLELRPGVKFTDGTALDSLAVKFNWERVLDPALNSPHAEAMRSVTLNVVDEHTLEIRLPRTDRTFDHQVAQELTYVGSPDAIRRDSAGFGQKPVGAGPFKLESWARDQKQEFVRNPNYWQGPDKPLLDKLVFAVEPNTPTMAVAQNRADLNFQDSERELRQARDAGLAMSGTPNAGGPMLAFNSGAAPFDDIKARQAVAWTLDQKQLATALGTGNEPALTVVPTGTPLYAQAPRQPAPDLAKAQQLATELRVAGKPLVFTMTCSQRQREACEAMQAMLKAAQIEATVDIKDANAYNQALATRSYQAVWGYDSGADLDVWLAGLTRSNSSSNYLQYRSTAVDGAWETIRTAATPEAKAAGYRTLLDTLAADTPWWLFNQMPRYALARKDTVTGLEAAFGDGVMRWDLVGRTKA